MAANDSPRRAAEMLEELRTGGSGFTRILDALAEAVTIRDPEHRIVYANPAALTRMGFNSLREIQDRSPDSILGDYLVHDERGQPLSMQDVPSVRLLAGESAEALVMRTINRTTGELRWNQLKATPLLDESGTPFATVTIIEDITAEKIAEQRDRFLAEATQSLMSSLDYEETLRNVAWLAVPELADWCAVDLVDGRGSRQRVVVAHPDPAKLTLAERLRRYDPDELNPEQGIGRVVSSGLSELYSEITDEMLVAGAVDEEHLRLLRAVGFRSALLVPLLTRGKVLGAMTLVTAESRRRLTEADKDFAEQLAQRAAIAVDNARLASARREVAHTLQQSLLPEVVPDLPGWQVAAMYRPAGAADEVEVGGDFYDFFESAGGWAVLIGDVTGKGVRAAAVTALVRHGARFLGKQQDSPAAILKQLNEALHEHGGRWLCSALCVLLGDEQVKLSCAGHPPPLLIRSDGRVRETGAAGPILGAWSESTWSDQPLTIGQDETLILYTDGVTDAVHKQQRFGVTRLRQLLATNAEKSPNELLVVLGDALDRFQGATQADDAAVIALRPTLSAERVAAGIAAAEGTGDTDRGIE